MSGKVVPILSRRSFEFSNTANGSNEIIIAKAIDVSHYTQGELYVRVHDGTSITGGAEIDVIARITSPSAEAPDSDFYYDTAVATVNVDSTASTDAPVLLRGALTSGFGGMLAISVRATPDSTPQTIRPILSVELVLKD